MNLLNVYILDDDQDAADYMACLLSCIEKINIQGIETDPFRAILQIAELKPDILFLDIEMPGLSGFELIEELGKQNLYPVIILTSSYLQYCVRAMRESVFDYLEKPFSIEELRQCIDKYREMKPQVQKRDISQIPDLNLIERKILEGLYQGKASTQIGDELCLSSHTIDKYRCQILKKLEVKSTMEMIALYTFS